MISDFHIHSYFSSDSDEKPENIIKTAIGKGMDMICFTDHQDFDYNYSDYDFTLDYEKYFAELTALKDKYKDKIQIRIGVETGLEPHLDKRLADFVQKKPYDFVIGSTHLINGVDPWYPEYFREYGDDVGFKKYFEYVFESLKTCHDFDVYGHLDYVVRYSPNGDKNYSYSKYKDIIDQILKKLIAMDKGIELNMGGMYKGMKNPNPNPQIISRYKELGGHIITVGADAHKAEYLGYKFELAKEKIKNAGFDYYTTFKGRKPEFIKL